MSSQANTAVKTIEGHYTGHFKAVITKPQNVYVMKDIMSNGYRAGGNTKFFGTSAAEVKTNLMKRLNMDDTDPDELQPSMLAFPMAASQYESGNMDTVMSVSSRLLPYEVASGAHTSFPGGQAAYDVYEPLLGLRAIHFGEDLRASENMEYMSQGSTNNALCFLGPHRKFDGLTKTFSQLVPGMGHWGPDARPGDVSHAPMSNARHPPPCMHARSLMFLSPFAGSLAPRRGGVNDVGARGHAVLRAARLHSQGQGLSPRQDHERRARSRRTRRLRGKKFHGHHGQCVGHARERRALGERWETRRTRRRMLVLTLLWGLLCASLGALAGLVVTTVVGSMALSLRMERRQGIHRAECFALLGTCALGMRGGGGVGGYLSGSVGAYVAARLV